MCGALGQESEEPWVKNTKRLRINPGAISGQSHPIKPPEDVKRHRKHENQVNDAEFLFQEHPEPGKEAEDEEKGGVGEGFHGVRSVTC